MNPLTVNTTLSGKLQVKKRRPNRLQRFINRQLARLPHALTGGYQLRGKLIEESGWMPNLILNGCINVRAAVANDGTATIYTYTSTSANYIDLDGTWNQSGNTVTRVSGSGVVPSSPSYIGNEIKWEDGERCHITARTSDTQFTVSGPPRTLTAKTIRVYFTNLASNSGSVQSATSSSNVVQDLTAGTWENTQSVVMPAASAPYTLGSVMVSTYARIVLAAPVAVEEFDQIELTYKLQAAATGREAHTVTLSEIISGYPYRFATSAISGNGTTMTITTSEPHNFAVADDIRIDGAVPLRHAITGITANGSAWTVTAPSHGLSPSDTVEIEDCTVAGYNGTHTVASAPDANTITITNAANPGAASDGTVRLATPATYFNGDWTVATVPNNTTITVSTDRTGPAIDPGSVTTSPDEATLAYWGSVFHKDGDAAYFTAFNEANEKVVPALNVTNLFSQTGASNSGSATGSALISGAAYTNDWEATSTVPSANAWSAGGSAENRVSQIHRGHRTGGGSQYWNFLLTFATPQPKATTHRLSYPNLKRKLTRDLPDY